MPIGQEISFASLIILDSERIVLPEWCLPMECIGLACTLDATW